MAEPVGAGLQNAQIPEQRQERIAVPAALPFLTALLTAFLTALQTAFLTAFLTVFEVPGVPKIFAQD